MEKENWRLKKMATGAIDKEVIIDITKISEPTKWCPECCIYAVPKRLRKINEEAYTPKLISIGPVHHYKDELLCFFDKQDELLKFKDMEMLKLKYFKEFFDRRVQKDFANIVVRNENKIRCCYEAGISLPEKEELVKMILLDSIFIIQLFLRTDAREKDENYVLSNEKDYILSKPWLDDGIRQDLILLENQLPFFILDELYDYFARSTTGVPKCFLPLALNYFFPDHKKITIDPKDVKHFTDLQRSFYCPPHLETGDRTIEHLYSVTKLNEAGLKFKKWEEKKLEHTCYSAKEEEEEEEEKHKCLLDMNIKKPCPRVDCSWLVHCFPCLKHFSCVEHLRTRLVIPPFVVDCKTEGLFRNLMALEQCHYPSHAYICNYIMLLDFLINTKDDVELLVDKRIIVNSLGSNKAVALMVNKLGQEIVERNSCFYKLAKDLNGHYDNLCNRNMASLKSVYFRDIWRGTATVVGIIALFVTIGNFLRPFFMHK